MQMQEAKPPGSVAGVTKGDESLIFADSIPYESAESEGRGILVCVAARAWLDATRSVSPPRGHQQAKEVL